MANKPKSFRPRGTPTAAERQKEYDRTRDRFQAGREFYKGRRWQVERADFLSRPENQFCVRCRANGLLNAGHLTGEGYPQTNPKRMHLVVHHSQRHYGDPDVFWDQSKWQPVCPDHHDGDIQAEESAAAKKLIERLEISGLERSGN